MRNLLLINIILLNSFMVWSQNTINCDINERMRNFTTKPIGVQNSYSKEFLKVIPDSIANLNIITNSDSVLNELLKKYDFIKKYKNSLKINCKNEQFLLRMIDDKGIKSDFKYSIEAILYDNFVVFYEEGFVYWNYYLIDLKSKNGYSMPSMPHIRVNEYVYGASDYYGDYDFKLYNLQNGKIFSFTLGETAVDKEFISENYLYLKVSNPCEKTKFDKTQFFKIRINSGL